MLIINTKGMVVLPNSLGYLTAAAIFPRTTKWFKRFDLVDIFAIYTIGFAIN